MSAYLRQILQDTPAGYWPLDEASGTTAFDRSGNARDGTYTIGNGALAAAGPAGMRAFDLGTTGSVQIADASAFSATEFTVEAWVYSPNAAGTAAIFGKYGLSAAAQEWLLYVNADESLELDVVNTAGGNFKSSVTGASAVSISEWHHYVGSYDATNSVLLYKDGVLLAGTQSGTGTRVGDTTRVLNIGLFGTSSGHLDGKVAHVGYYGAALSLARIKCHFEAGIRNGVVVG